MSIRAFAANMVLMGTLPFNGFPKDLWSPKSEFYPLFLEFMFKIMLSLYFLSLV